MDRFLVMTCFARAVETGRFSAAGRDLGLGQPNVSRHVAALEEHLQTRLLHRSTRKLALTPEGERVFVASKGYLAKRSVPVTPDDLRGHDCVIYTLLSSGATWRFRDTEVPVSGRLRVNSPEAVRELVNAGLGIGHGPEWLFEEGLKNGNLQLLLTGYTAPPVPVQILYVANRLLPTRAVVFMDFIAKAFSKVPALNTPDERPLAG